MSDPGLSICRRSAASAPRGGSGEGARSKARRILGRCPAVSALAWFGLRSAISLAPVRFAAARLRWPEPCACGMAFCSPSQSRRPCHGDAVGPVKTRCPQRISVPSILWVSRGRSGLIHDAAAQHLALFLRAHLTATGCLRAIVAVDALFHTQPPQNHDETSAHTRPDILAYQRTATTDLDPAGVFHMCPQSPAIQNNTRRTVLGTATSVGSSAGGAYSRSTNTPGAT